MKKLETNTDLVMDLMEISPYGAMTQIFIIDAITKLVDKVIDSEKELLEMEEKNKGFISMPAWIGTAKDIKKRMQEFYDSKNGKKEEEE